MKDHIIFELTDRTPEAIVMKVTGNCDLVTAVSQIRLEPGLLEDLQQEIREFLQEQDLESYWETDVPGLGLQPCVSMRFLPRDDLGNVLLELYMELNDGGDFSRHVCCFYVHTDRRELEAFCNALPCLLDSPVGTAVVLNRS